MLREHLARAAIVLGSTATLWTAWLVPHAGIVGLVLLATVGQGSLIAAIAASVWAQRLALRAGGRPGRWIAVPVLAVILGGTWNILWIRFGDFLYEQCNWEQDGHGLSCPRPNRESLCRLAYAGADRIPAKTVCDAQYARTQRCTEHQLEAIRNNQACGAVGLLPRDRVLLLERGDDGTDSCTSWCRLP